MCKAFSCIVTRSGEVLWEAGVDSHDEIIENAKLPVETEEHPAKLLYARVEITPSADAEDGYLHPELQWVLRIDQNVWPTWFKRPQEEAALKACEEWKKKVYSMINLAEVLNPVNPFKIEPPTQITAEHIKLLKTWATVWDTVEATVWDMVWDTIEATVGDTVWATVWDTVEATVWDTVGDTVRDTVGAYIGSLFPGITDWNGCEKLGVSGYPFQSAVDLWRLGLVVNFDGETWRLHSKNGVALEISREELMETG